MNTYAGVLESINLLMAKNNNVKQSYEKFIKDYSATFDALERRIRNDCKSTLDAFYFNDLTN